MMKINVEKFKHRCDYEKCERHARVLILVGKYCRVHAKEIEGSYKSFDKILIITSPVLLNYSKLSNNLKKKVKE